MNYIEHETIKKMKFDDLLKAGLINETAVRNHKIKEDYENLRNRGERPLIAKEMLAETYSVSEDTINKILYTENNKNV
jgi:hypothetical protein